MVYIRLAAVFIFFRDGIGKIQFQEMIRVVNVRVVTITPLSHSYVCPASISARVLCVLTLTGQKKCHIGIMHLIL